MQVNYNSVDWLGFFRKYGLVPRGKRQRRKNGSELVNVFSAFDIETSTIWKSEEHTDAHAFMYVWQMQIEDYLIKGRTWEEWFSFLDVLKTALGRENRQADYNQATWHSEVRAWDLAASTAILRELGGDIIGADGKPLSAEILSSPSAKIAFIASGSEDLRKAIYDKYKSAEKKNVFKKDEDISK